MKKILVFKTVKNITLGSFKKIFESFNVNHFTLLKINFNNVRVENFVVEFKELNDFELQRAIVYLTTIFCGLELIDNKINCSIVSVNDENIEKQRQIISLKNPKPLGFYEKKARRDFELAVQHVRDSLPLNSSLFEDNGKFFKIKNQQFPSNCFNYL